MALTGKYHCSEINSTINITEADNRTGQASGTIEIGGSTISINIFYHFENSVGPVTNLWLAGNKNDPNQYVGAAGVTENTSFSTIRVAGGYSAEAEVNTFEGTYRRQ
ncbi:MAG: hypothetical protein ACRBFS_22775 [Aureispira sp.]